jgi:hypothetical protein
VDGHAEEQVERELVPVGEHRHPSPGIECAHQPVRMPRYAALGESRQECL